MKQAITNVKLSGYRSPRHNSCCIAIESAALLGSIGSQAQMFEAWITVTFSSFMSGLLVVTP